jgi:hypothetical protein
MGLVGIMMLALVATPLQADLIQCQGDGCEGSETADVINGTPGYDDIEGNGGNDVIFGQGGDDDIDADEGNNVIFGGLGSDFMESYEGNDLIFPGPDGPPSFFQETQSGMGNDTTTVFVSEISGCLVVSGDTGLDAVNLVGFGPFVATLPFGQPGFVTGWIQVVDPVALGDIFIEVIEGGDAGNETVNGLLSPNVTIVDVLPDNCLED